MTLLLLIFSILALSPIPSRSTVGEGQSFIGIWKGDSVCQMRDSPCHDEASVYYVSKGSEADTFQMKMNKIVEGKEQTLGTVNCKADSSTASYVCRLNEL